MAETTPVTAWLYCFDANASFPLCDIAAALQQAGVAAEITTSPEQMEAAHGTCESDTLSRPGIVFFSAVTSLLCDFVRTCSQYGLRRLLAVTMRDALTDGTAWQVLEAGASDVLAWNAAGDTTGTIVARVQRWYEVDAVVSSALVQNHLVGESPVWRGLLRQVVEVARFAEPDDASVLLIGETGTGKELIARLIHSLSPQRARRDLVILDCTTIVPELSGSELFGHERGAFTGAIADATARLRLPTGGPSSLTKLGSCLWACKRSYCVWSKSIRSSGSGVTPGTRPTSAWCVRPIATCWWKKPAAGFDVTCTTASQAGVSGFPRCASAWKTSLPWHAIS